MTEVEKVKFEMLMKERPHVVILGAGASVATIPNGDINGKKISVMNNFFENTGMIDLLHDIKLETKSKNLEDIYNEVYENESLRDLKGKLEKAIYTYFYDIEIPKEPTIYDLLLLSLRSKDLIATFNWDPLLLQAYQRVSKITNDLPDLSFLHGNVLVGVCEKDKRGGCIGNNCPVCNEPFTPIPLLYPIKKKEYNKDLFNRDSWNTVKKYLERAYIITIFGYSAPPSDVEAIKMLKEAWGDNQKRNLEETEIIDIKEDDQLLKTWEPFINSHHYEIKKSFYQSIIGSFPRRSCECIFDQFMNCKWLRGDKGLKENMSWSDVKKYFGNLLNDENQNKDGLLTDFWTEGN